MKELEKKLKMLGYSRSGQKWCKKVSDSLIDTFIIELYVIDTDTICSGIIVEDNFIVVQSQITCLQHVYDVMIKDLEILEC